MKLPVKVRCSGLDQLFSCHGSLIASSLVPARTGEEGAEGSVIHALIAARLVDEFKAIPPEGGLEQPKVSPGFKLSPFSSWVVDWCVRHVKETVPVNWSLMVEMPIDDVYAMPRPVSVEGEAGELVSVRTFELSGHLDVFAMSPDGTKSIGIDWKSGVVGADPADQNWQASGYLSLTHRGWPDLEESTFQLCQPRIDEESTGVPRISSVTLSGEQLHQMSAVLSEAVAAALENRFETNSGPKQCRYCPVAATRPWLCPSLQAEKDFMKAKLTPTILQELQAAPNDALLGDFVISGRTLDGPVKAATELLHERIAVRGYVDSGSGHRLTTTTRPGKYKLVDADGAWDGVNRLIPGRVARVVNYSKDRLVDEIAEAQGIPKSGKKDRTAEKVFKEEVACFMEQGETKLLVIT